MYGLKKRGVNAVEHRPDGVSVLEVRQGETKFACLIDTKDYAALSGFHFSVSSSGYVTTTNRPPVPITRLLLPGVHPNHKNGNLMDNRRANLRAMTRSEMTGGARKRKGCVAASSSIFKGVKRVGLRFRVSISGRHLGYFETEEEAARIFR